MWIRKGVEARCTRSVGRIARLVEMRKERAERRNVQGKKSGKIVAELTDVTKRYGERTIVDRFTATVMRGDKIGFVGPNGAGKTTLLKLILSELQPDDGRVRTGTNIQAAYFDQMRAQLDLDKSLADTISPGSEWVEVNGVKKHVSYLGDFLFAPERALACSRVPRTCSCSTSRPTISTSPRSNCSKNCWLITTAPCCW